MQRTLASVAVIAAQTPQPAIAQTFIVDAASAADWTSIFYVLLGLLIVAILAFVLFMLMKNR